MQPRLGSIWPPSLPKTKGTSQMTSLFVRDEVTAVVNDSINKLHTFVMRECNYLKVGGSGWIAGDQKYQFF
jgi:hypothetical protein